MNLTTAEESAYKAIYNKIALSTQLTKGTCIKLMVKRGGIDQETANQIWNKSSNNQNETKLTQQQFYLLLKSVAAVQSGLKFEEIPDVSKLKELKIPKFPKSEDKKEKSSGDNNSNKTNDDSKKLQKSNKNGNNSENSSSRSDLHEQKMNDEIHEKPRKVSYLKNLEATVDLNRDEGTEKKTVENYDTPIFNHLSNESVSVDLDEFKSFKLHSIENGKAEEEEDKEFRLNEDFTNKISKTLSFLQSVNQMPVHLDANSKKTEEKPKIAPKITPRYVEITDYVMMKKGYLDSSYYIYRISSRKNEETCVVERRYSDFEWLHSYLINHPKYQGLLIPKLPEKHGIGASFFTYLGSDADFIKKRKHDLENYLRETLEHEILHFDEVLEKFLTLNSNDFNILKSHKNIYDQNTDSSSFLKMPTPANLKSFYQFYEHAQAYLYTKYNTVIKKKKSCETEHLDALIEGINRVSGYLKKIFDGLKKIQDLQKENAKSLSIPKEQQKNESEVADFLCLNNWEEYFSFCILNNQGKDSQILENIEIVLKKIEVVNIAQGNLSNYIANLDYAINLYENKRNSLVGNHSGNLNEEGNELKQLQYKINSLQESIKQIESNLLKELNIFQEKLEKDIGEIFKKLIREKKELFGVELHGLLNTK